ncbi:pimeloyl-ACP methyl ester carboxylesterase [Aminobacter lissarensis]|uniref:Pimeloyl-ACP methyl ester carboxylesterase n=1 Tax=Aminobacter carboxidus TaxID=376165 RepID=A0A8E2BCY2_9HYPH|nr:alpha/beta hydrolase [Aminobacter lissarensis]MBB6466704.1 pimeloyl-ACP methyl ester carboxylesterase [Aminobacter lissarensis]
MAGHIQRTSRQGHGIKLSYYDFGATPFFACQMDQRFSYCLHVPEGYSETDAKIYNLAVIVHGTGRTATWYRDRFADFADNNDCIILAPLFPVGIIEPGELSNYKRIDFHGIRYDHILLSMVDEVCAKYRVRDDGFLMYGYSGGGQFCQRFFMLHPQRLRAVSIGAPGVVTLLNADYDWWVGVRDIEQRFGHRINLEAMRRVEVQTVIGSEDTQTWEITIPRDSKLWMDGAELQGENRLDRIEALAGSFEAGGIRVRRNVVSGIAHSPFDMAGPAEEFFTTVISKTK